MIDLETLSTNPDAVILTVGGVKFDPYTQMKPYDELYFRVDVDSQTAMGRDVMIKKINKFSVGVDVFWCQGPLFDYAILQNIYRQMKTPIPWQYWQIRDSRTLFSLVPKDYNEQRTGLHNALQDCIFQAKKVQRVYKQLGI